MLPRLQTCYIFTNLLGFNGLQIFMREYWCTSPGQLITRSGDEACKPGEDPSGFDNGTKLENQKN